MPRILHVSDLHVTDGHRLEDVRGYLEAIAGVVEHLEHPPELALITGDLYGRTVPHRSSPTERAVLYPFVTAVAALCPVVIVVGNHDHGVDVAGLRHLAGRHTIHVIDRAAKLAIPTPSGVVNVYGMPFPTKRWLLAGEDVRGVAESQAAVEEKLELLLTLWGGAIARARRARPTEAHVLAAHVQVAGCRTSGGEVLAGNEIELRRPNVEAMRVDYGALGHLHLCQEVAARCWYVGSPWRNDHGERDDKGWHLVDVGDDWAAGPVVVDPEGGTEPQAWSGTHYDGEHGGRHPVRVLRFDSGCRRFVTLDYRWASVDGAAAGGELFTTEAAGWVSYPTEDELRLVEGAEVRARLTVPQQWATSCPWAAEVSRLIERFAHRVIPERTVEPTVRARAPEVAEALTPTAKVERYWTTLESPPSKPDKAAALQVLDELLQEEDSEITETTDLLLEAPTCSPAA
jgi:DNA repair exonuclease SbcCD nuclease subunit